MNDYKYHYLFTTFDIERFDLEDFKYNFVNMTAFRVVNVGDLSVQKVLKDMARFQTIRNAPAFNASFIEVSIFYAQCCNPLLWIVQRSKKNFHIYHVRVIKGCWSPPNM